jgi:hypothetical protein
MSLATSSTTRYGSLPFAILTVVRVPSNVTDTGVPARKNLNP